MKRAEDLDRSAVLAALRDANGNVGRAARKLGCARRTLQNRMREYHIPEGHAGRPKRRLHFSPRARRTWLAGAAAALVGGVIVLHHRRKPKEA